MEWLEEFLRRIALADNGVDLAEKRREDENGRRRHPSISSEIEGWLATAQGISLVDASATQSFSTVVINFQRYFSGGTANGGQLSVWLEAAADAVRADTPRFLKGKKEGELRRVVLELLDATRERNENACVAETELAQDLGRPLGAVGRWVQWAIDEGLAEVQVATNSGGRCLKLTSNGIDWLEEARESDDFSQSEKAKVPMSLSNSQFDVVIICALHSPELEMVMKTGDANWPKLASDPHDPSSYYAATFTTKKGTALRIVAAAPTQVGMPASAVLATKMILRFRPRLVAMVGIAAGAKSEDQNIGDILAPDQTFDYGAGKITSDANELRFVPDPNPATIEPRLRDRLLHWRRDTIHLDAIRRGWNTPKVTTLLQLHVGPLGSGAAVLGTHEPVERVLEHWRKLIGIEMEAYAVHIACRDAVAPPPAFLCVKSICDFATHKTDGGQPYAAYTAAEFLHRFLVEEWEELHLEPHPH